MEYRDRSTVLALVVGAILVLTGGATHAADDFSWMRGANYVPSYAATSVEMWLRYDHDTIDRELGYASKLRLNCVRVFLQSLVYHHEPDAMLERFEDFLATADAHGLKVMPRLMQLLIVFQVLRHQGLRNLTNHLEKLVVAP